MSFINELPRSKLTRYRQQSHMFILRSCLSPSAQTLRGILPILFLRSPAFIAEATSAEQAKLRSIIAEENQKGLSLLRLLIIIAVVCVVIGGGFILLNSEKATARDSRRLSDVSRLQAAFELLYSETASYAGASENGCDQVGALVSTCNVSAYLPTIAQFKDPGKYSYKISQVPSDEGYEVTFYLEKSYDGLKAGKHTVGPAGIK